MNNFIIRRYLKKYFNACFYATPRNIPLADGKIDFYMNNRKVSIDRVISQLDELAKQSSMFIGAEMDEDDFLVKKAKRELDVLLECVGKLKELN